MIMILHLRLPKQFLEERQVVFQNERETLVILIPCGWMEQEVALKSS